MTSDENQFSNRDVRWYLGGYGEPKTMHRPGCRYAKMPYKRAGDLSVGELVEQIVESGALEWHRGCRLCSPALAEILDSRRRTP